MVKKLLSVAICFAMGVHYSAIAQSTFSKTSQLQPASTTSATIVIILDDIGHSLPLGQRAIQLPGAINYSILPQSPNGVRLAQTAHKQGKEVMLHMPMSNINGRRMEPGALTPIMDKEEFITALRKSLGSIPYVQGVNNHMGSLLTQLHQPMSWFMKELKEQQLYFVDSRTSPLTVAESVAKNYKLPHLRRHVFLDNQRDERAISAQFERLIKLALKHGTAVAIGHPYPETLDFLEQTLPALSFRGIRLAYVSEVISTSQDSCLENPLYRQATTKNCLKFSQLTTINSRTDKRF